MRIVVIGATGNVGTSLLPMLSDDPEVDRVVGVARRPPNIGLAKLSWRAADIAVDDLGPIVADADVCVHLAWEVQPSHDEFAMSRTNVHGTARLLKAVIEANVPRWCTRPRWARTGRGRRTVRSTSHGPRPGSRTPRTRGRRRRSRRCSTSSKALGPISAWSGCGRR